MLAVQLVPVPPGIALTRSVIDAVDVAGETGARQRDGWNVTYRFVVENTGNTPLSGVNVADGKCDVEPTRTQGSGERLQPGATWTYECPKLIRRAQLDERTSTW